MRHAKFDNTHFYDYAFFSNPEFSGHPNSGEKSECFLSNTYDVFGPYNDIPVWKQSLVGTQGTGNYTYMVSKQMIIYKIVRLTATELYLFQKHTGALPAEFPK